jgi:hypothetical protein
VTSVTWRSAAAKEDISGPDRADTEIAFNVGDARAAIFLGLRITGRTHRDQLASAKAKQERVNLKRA